MGETPTFDYLMKCVIDNTNQQQQSAHQQKHMVSDSQIFNHSFGTATLQTISQQPTSTLIEQQSQS